MEENNKPNTRRIFLQAIFLFIAVLGVNFVSWRLGRMTTAQNTRKNFETHARSLEVAIRERLGEYTDDLDHMKALFAVNPGLGRGGFTQVVAGDKGPDEGKPGWMWVSRVGKKDLDAFTAKVRADKSLSPYGFPFFSPRIGEEKEEYYLVDYLYPHEEYKGMFGNDIGLDPELLAYFKKAEQRNGQVITPPLQFFNTTRILMIQPVYVKPSGQGAPALTGFAVIILSPDHLFDDLLASDKERISYAIYDGPTEGKARSFYEDSNETGDYGKSFTMAMDRKITVCDRSWRVKFSSRSGAATVEGYLPDLLFASMFILSTSVFALLFLNLFARWEKQ